VTRSFFESLDLLHRRGHDAGDPDCPSSETPVS
jgi:hypothetical protein